MEADLQTRLVRDLVTESIEGLDQFDDQLLAIENGESSDETLNVMFRIIHSLKGTSGCLGLNRIEALSHVGENLLSMLREGQIVATPPMITTMLQFADALRAMLSHLSTEGIEPEDDHAVLVRDLQALSKATAAAPEPVREVFGLFEDEPEVRTPRQIARSAPEAVAASPARQPPAANEGAIRVDIEQLDNLMDLVGELVLARNQIVQFAGLLREPVLQNATQRLNLITTQLQENVMKTRMQPIGNVWAKFPRIVRDISLDLGKQVNLSLVGSETELDRTIVEAIKDPLTHLIRNAIDHGLETPERRQSVGKAPEGTLRVRAFHEGGQVNIEIFDDGAGVDCDKVLNRALQKGLITADQMSRMTDRETHLLLFAPGFSTAEKVTNLSGRGVGMDVVKKNVEAIGGSVDIESEFGRSTTVRIKIPLTLAIIPALIIGCGGARYAIPQASLLELVRIEAGQAESTIEFIDSAPVYRLRGNLLPLVFLREQLELPGKPDSDDSSVFLLVMQAEGQPFGLVVDAISDTEEIVVKPLGKELKRTSVYAGATIMGDGRVALILDVIGIARRAKVLDQLQSATLQLNNAAEAQRKATAASSQRLLLFALGANQQAAIPLSQVERLEELPAERVERSGNVEVIQYRGEIMPLLRVSQALHLQEGEQRGSLSVIVHNENGTNVGLIVDRILDTVDEAVMLQRAGHRPGILGSAIIGKRVTDFVDTAALIRNSEVGQFGAVQVETDERH